MALSRDKKEELVAEVSQLFKNSKLTVLANYSGLSVKQIQELRQSAKNNETKLKVVKNRLVLKAMDSVDTFKDTDKSIFKDQLLYAFNSDDEVAPAQVLANFAKKNKALEFVGAVTAEGEVLSVEDVKNLANLPSKDQLRSQLVGTIAAPLSGFVNVLAGNVRGVLNVLNARAESL
ncbi:MAG TPA: 50S ribosomal protein L10 [Patescibacteria group bacterium]|nr:50S ribosomal protein L10 [Patescibacteria group bacterium]